MERNVLLLGFRIDLGMQEARALAFGLLVGSGGFSRDGRPTSSSHSFLSVEGLVILRFLVGGLDDGRYCPLFSDANTHGAKAGCWDYSGAAGVTRIHACISSSAARAAG